MRAIIRSTGELSGLRDSLRRDVAQPEDVAIIVEDFIAAVNEVVAAAVEAGVTGQPSIDVRWRRRTHPRLELWAEIRSVTGTPMSLIDGGVPARLLQRYAERVDFEERIGGSLITVRSRV